MNDIDFESLENILLDLEFRRLTLEFEEIDKMIFEEKLKLILNKYET